MRTPAILLVDIGNSRAKWASFDAGTLGPQAAASHASWGVADWRGEIERLGAKRVVAASVAAPAARATLVEASRQAIGSEPEFVEATAEAAGVRNGYSNPAQLGVDRWLAIIGAFHRQRAATCVIDVGTAMTVDAVNDTGVHLGGFIVPGPRLMVSVLLTGTSDLAGRASWASMTDPTWFANNTRDAIEKGCRIALARLAEDALRRLPAHAGAKPRLQLTGGDAELLLPWLDVEVDLVPDLVLQGLARLVESGQVPRAGSPSGPSPG